MPYTSEYSLYRALRYEYASVAAPIEYVNGIDATKIKLVGFVCISVFKQSAANICIPELPPGLVTSDLMKDLKT
jgi:hypothetical protein